MKNKQALLLLLMFLVLLLAASCSVPRGLPAPEELPYETKGAAFYVKLYDGSVYRGELIAAENDALYVLPAENQHPNMKRQNRLVQIPWDAVDNYRVYYAHGKSLAWFVPVYTVMTLSHGWVSILTMPINLIATLTAHVNSQHEHVLRKKDIAPEALNLFARFPQGIPQRVSPQDIF
jgi:hypothetical protein